MRADPAATPAVCPVCGAGVSGESGDPTPMHQETGTLDECPGSGRPDR